VFVTGLIVACLFALSSCSKDEGFSVSLPGLSKDSVSVARLDSLLRLDTLAGLR
jgi:hypothetical protein